MFEQFFNNFLVRVLASSTKTEHFRSQIEETSYYPVSWSAVRIDLFITCVCLCVWWHLIRCFDHRRNFFRFRIPFTCHSRAIDSRGYQLTGLRRCGRTFALNFELHFGYRAIRFRYCNTSHGSKCRGFLPASQVSLDWFDIREFWSTEVEVKPYCVFFRKEHRYPYVTSQFDVT